MGVSSMLRELRNVVVVVFFVVVVGGLGVAEADPTDDATL